MAAQSSFAGFEQLDPNYLNQLVSALRQNTASVHMTNRNLLNQLHVFTLHLLVKKCQPSVQKARMCNQKSDNMVRVLVALELLNQ